MIHPRLGRSSATFDRRQLLTGMAAGACLPWGLRLADDEQLAAAKKARTKTLVVVFLRGGADGLNLVVPHADEHYHRLRPGLAIPRPGEAGGALDIDGTFGFHPGCAPFAALEKEGLLAAIHAVGHPDNTRSHFEEQDRWELLAGSKDAAPGAMNLSTPGWLNRYLASAAPRGPIRAIALGSQVPRSLRGDVTALAVPRLEALGNPGGQSGSGAGLEATLRALDSAYGRKGKGSKGLDAALAKNGVSALEAMRRLGEVARQPMEFKGKYPADAFGTQCQEAARLIHADLGVEVVQIDLQGFDTHQNQAAPFATRMSSLAQGLGALRADLANRLDDVMVITVSEFGRTARVNGTLGTDHGGGSCVLAMGGAIRAADGSRRGVLGDWPTLAPDALQSSRDLRVTTDIRNVYSEILTRFFGCQELEKALPGWTASPVGLVS